MAGILSRMAAKSDQEIAWDEAVASNLELAPGLDRRAPRTGSPADD